EKRRGRGRHERRAAAAADRSFARVRRARGHTRPSNLCRKPTHEALEVGKTGASLPAADPHEVVDAAVLLQDVNDEASRDAVELGDELRPECLATIEVERLLRDDLPIGEMQEEVMRQ